MHSMNLSTVLSMILSMLHTEVYAKDHTMENTGLYSMHVFKQVNLSKKKREMIGYDFFVFCLSSCVLRRFCVLCHANPTPSLTILPQGVKNVIHKDVPIRCFATIF